MRPGYGAERVGCTSQQGAVMQSSKRCPKCMGLMQERVFRRMQDPLLYCLLYVGVTAGVALTFYSSLPGRLIGPVVIVLALWCGLQVQGAWVCPGCGYSEGFRHFGQ